MPGYNPVRLSLCDAGTPPPEPDGEPAAVEVNGGTALSAEVRVTSESGANPVTNRCEDDPATELPVDESDIDLDSITIVCPVQLP
jgi:hypothetical protein